MAVSSAGARFGEQSRRVAARTTKTILKRRGSKLGMVLGVGFPKSGTVWLCQLMSTALGLPYPREYRSPIAMESVIHAHWRYDPRFPKAAYIRRDGRDVMISLYFYYVRALTIASKPARAADLRNMFERIYGSSFDPDDVRKNLPRFIEAQSANPRGSDGLTWHQHISDWWDQPGVTHVTYEDLHRDPVKEVLRLMRGMDADPDEHIARLAVDRWSMSTTTRRDGVEDRTSFQRKGIMGDWTNHFTEEAGEIFDSQAGDALVEFGYAADRTWYQGLGS